MQHYRPFQFVVLYADQRIECGVALRALARLDLDGHNVWGAGCVDHEIDLSDPSLVEVVKPLMAVSLRHTFPDLYAKYEDIVEEA